MQRVHNMRRRQPNPWKVQHRSCLESNYLGLYHTCSGGPSSPLSLKYTCIPCSSTFLFSPRDQSARQQWSESSPVPKPASGANFDDLGVLQSSINSGSATTTGWPTPRTVASSTCALRTGRSTRRRATNPWPLTRPPGRANQRRR